MDSEQVAKKIINDHKESINQSKKSESPTKRAINLNSRKSK